MREGGRVRVYTSFAACLSHASLIFPLAFATHVIHAKPVVAHADLMRPVAPMQTHVRVMVGELP